MLFQKLNANARVDEVSGLVIAICKKYFESPLTEDLYIKEIFDELNNDSIKLTQAIKQSKAESNLAEKDNERDENLRAVRYIIKGATFSPDAEIRTIGENLNKVFEKYGLELVKKSYSETTAEVTSLIVEFATPPLVEDVKKVEGLFDTLSNLNDSEDRFQQAYNFYETMKAKEGERETASEIKKRVVKQVNDKIVVYLKAMVQVDPVVYGELATTVAQMIADQNEVVKKRTKKEKVEEQEDTPNE